MFEDDHDNYSGNDCDEVAKHYAGEIVLRAAILNAQKVFHKSVSFSISLLLGSDEIIELLLGERSEKVVSESHAHEHSRDNNISKSEDRELRGYGGQILREHELDGSIDVLSDSQHDISAKDKENVIEEKESQENVSGLEVSNEQVLESVDAEQNANNVVVDPTLGNKIDVAHDGRESEAGNVEDSDIQVNVLVVDRNNLGFVKTLKERHAQNINQKCFNRSGRTDCDVCQ